MTALNEHQRRNLSVTLVIIEESLAELEKIVASPDYHGILLDRKNNIRSSVKDYLLNHSQLIRARIRVIAERFGLDRVHRETGREINAKLSYCWEILQDTRADKLKRYGEIEENIKEVLDPDLDTIIGLVTEMEDCLTGKGAG
jgi:hypothetical protein